MIGPALKTRRTAIWSAALMAFAMIASLTNQVWAQDSWTASISEKELMLAHPNDPMWAKWLMWDIGFQRMVDRNMPYLEVMNAATSTDPITQFHLTIGDNRFNFAPVSGTDLVVLGSTTPGFTLAAHTCDPSTESCKVSGLGDELVVNIGGGGLLPGQLVRFKIKLGIDPSFAATYAASFGSSLPDYRTVLFDMNGVNVYDGITQVSSADNAGAFVVFDTNIKSNFNVFPDEPVAAGQFFNNNLRAYTELDAVNLFTLVGQVIPEPGTISLATFGVACFCLKVRSRSRRTAA